MIDVTQSELDSRQDLADRLARIEENLKGQATQLVKVLALLDRMVLLEANQSSVATAINKLEVRLKEVEVELLSWRTTRRVVAWIIGIITAGAGTASVLAFQSIIERL